MRLLTLFSAGLGNRENDAKRRAVSLAFTYRHYRTPVKLDDVSHDRKAKPKTAAQKMRDYRARMRARYSVIGKGSTSAGPRRTRPTTSSTSNECAKREWRM